MSKQTTSTLRMTEILFKMVKEMVSILSVTGIQDSSSPVEERGSLDVSCSLVIHDHDSMLQCHFVRYQPHSIFLYLSSHV